MLYPDTKIVVFTRAPEPGTCKTRLIPALGEIGAAKLQQRMAQLIIDALTAAELAPMELQCDPDSRHAFFMKLLDQYCIELNPQQGPNLGARMAHAVNKNLPQFHYVIIVGTDAPCLTPGYVQNAIEALHAGVDLVIGPAQDGGYVLIGMKHYHGELFDNIGWGTGQVLQQTLDKARQLNLSVHQLPVLWDVDTPNDLDRIRQDARLACLLEPHDELSSDTSGHRSVD